MRSAKTLHAELDGLAGVEQRRREEHEARASRLVQALATNLEDFWMELPSLVGLASSLDGQLTGLQMFSHVEMRQGAAKTPKGKKGKRARKGKAPSQAVALLEHLAETETPGEAIARRAREATAHLPAHVQLDIPAEELPQAVPVIAGARRSAAATYWNPRDGLHGDERPGDVRAARGCKEQRLHCAGAATGSGCVRMATVEYEDPRTGVSATELVEAPLLLEGWVDWTKNAGQQRRKHQLVRRTLLRMLERGRADLVAVLYAVHGGSVPDRGPAAGLAWEFPFFKDLSPVVLFTKEVMRHAALMTQRLRKANTIGACQPRRVTRTTTRRLEATWLAGESVEWPLNPADLDGHRRPFSPSEMLGVIGMREVDSEEVPIAFIDRRETVTLRTAAHDLLDSKSSDSPAREAARVSTRNLVMLQAEVLMHSAGVAYHAAHRDERGLMKREEFVYLERREPERRRGERERAHRRGLERAWLLR